DAGIEMRQQPRFIEHCPRRTPEVLERARGAQLGKRSARRRVPQLRLITEREERLLAAGGRAGTPDGEHLIDVEVRVGEIARHLGKGAVTAHIAAETGERKEHLARVSDLAAEARKGEAFRGRKQGLRRALRKRGERLRFARSSTGE